MGGWDVLARHFDGLTADEVDAELADVPAPATVTAADYLAEHGGPDLDDRTTTVREIHRRRTLTAARTLSETLRSALTLDQAAEALGLSRSRVAQRLRDRSLWAFTVRGHRYVPRWQIAADGQTIPGLSEVVRAIPSNVHPLAIEAFMTTARPDFDARSSVGWLISGGDPAVVADWLVGMAHESAPAETTAFRAPPAYR